MGWTIARGPSGGNVVSLVQPVESLSKNSACTRCGGESRPIHVIHILKTRLSLAVYPAIRHGYGVPSHSRERQRGPTHSGKDIWKH